MREDMLQFLFTYGDDIGYWFGVACVLVTAWFCFVAAVHGLTRDDG